MKRTTEDQHDEDDDANLGYGLPPRSNAAAPDDNEQLRLVREALSDPRGITFIVGRTDGVHPRSGPDMLTTRLLWLESAGGE